MKSCQSEFHKSTSPASANTPPPPHRILFKSRLEHDVYIYCIYSHVWICWCCICMKWDNWCWSTNEPDLWPLFVWPHDDVAHGDDVDGVNTMLVWLRLKWVMMAKKRKTMAKVVIQLKWFWWYWLYLIEQQQHCLQEVSFHCSSGWNSFELNLYSSWTKGNVWWWWSHWWPHLTPMTWVQWSRQVTTTWVMNFFLGSFSLKPLSH